MYKTSHTKNLKKMQNKLNNCSLIEDECSIHFPNLKDVFATEAKCFLHVVIVADEDLSFELRVEMISENTCDQRTVILSL
jgi:hypothetical protein